MQATALRSCKSHLRTYSIIQHFRVLLSCSSSEFVSTPFVLLLRVLLLLLLLLLPPLLLNVTLSATTITMTTSISHMHAHSIIKYGLVLLSCFSSECFYFLHTTPASTTTTTTTTTTSASTTTQCYSLCYHYYDEDYISDYDY